MSNAFAIAAVTAVMRNLLSQRMAEAKSGGIVDQDASVVAQAPDLIPVGSAESSRLNLFLYEVAPNSGWACDRLPSRDSAGNPVTRPALALDLNYLLSVFCSRDMEAEILLGHAMQAFHETPGLSRSDIRKLLDPTPPDGPDTLPKAFRERAVTLAEQIELVKITPRYLALEDMSKVWSSLQTHYRPSVVYRATVVLIESRAPARSPLPVLTRGETDRGVRVEPGLIPPFPTLLDVRVPDRQPAVVAGGKIELFGHHLQGSQHVVRFRHVTLGTELVARDAALAVGPPGLSPEELAQREILRLADTRIEVDLTGATPAGQWAAGQWSVQVELIPSGESEPRATNASAVAIAPQYVTGGASGPVVTKAAPVTGTVAVTVKLTVTPPLRPRQRSSLLLANRELLGPEVTAPTTDPTFVGRLPEPMAAAGTQHLARLRVDGVESLYIVRNEWPESPTFDPSQRITMP